MEQLGAAVVLASLTAVVERGDRQYGVTKNRAAGGDPKSLNRKVGGCEVEPIPRILFYYLRLNAGSMIRECRLTMADLRSLQNTVGERHPQVQV